MTPNSNLSLLTGIAFSRFISTPLEGEKEDGCVIC